MVNDGLYTALMEGWAIYCFNGGLMMVNDGLYTALMEG